MKNLITLLFLLIFFIPNTRSQEIYCNVQVNARQVEGSDKQVFETLQNSLFDFINSRVWSNYSFEVEERIECSILLTISERVSSEEFKGSLTIALSRPVYNSSYNSVVINYVDDDFAFKYTQNQPLDFSENTYISNITSVIGFYAYILLGLDFDTFLLNGGTAFYEKAEAIVSAAQSANTPGWKAFEDDRNRYWLVENLLNPSYKPLRKFLYEYHRKGLDVMYENPESGRSAIIASLNHLKKVYDERPGLFLIQLMMDAKRPELIGIFSEGSSTEKTKAVNLLKEIDPSHGSDYDEILSN